MRSAPRWMLSLVLLSCPAVAQATEGLVALQTAEASCRTTTTPPPRFVDCDNGTVTDNKTGLIWLKHANCFGLRVWREATDIIAGLSDMSDEYCDRFNLEPDECDCDLSDKSAPGEWRLPSASEWETLLGDAVALGCTDPAVLDDEGTGCWSVGCRINDGCSFRGVQRFWYWSSSTNVEDPARGVAADLVSGVVFFGQNKETARYVWPVWRSQ